MAAEDFDQSRTEAPTPRRREEAREQGQVAVSTELTTAAVLLAGLVALTLAGPKLGQGLLDAVRTGMRHLPTNDLGPDEAQELLVNSLGQGWPLIGWFLGALVGAALAATAAQVGFHLVPGLASAKLDRLGAAKGWGKLFSQAGVVRGLAGLAKVAVVLGVVFLVLRNRLGLVGDLGEMRLAETLGKGWSLVLTVSMAAVGALALLGAMDYGWQRWRHEQAMRMTRQELKEEAKQEEGDPHTKARIRKLQREASRQRMFQDVPKATVVITNPTHLAVALSYDRGSMAAPRVVAKGAGLVAKRIVEMARRHAVPVLERKPVAQALYKAVRVGQEIPLPLYQVVAEVLAYVYRLRGNAA